MNGYCGDHRSVGYGVGGDEAKPFRLRVRPDAPAITSTVAEVEALKADNARLRALIRMVESCKPDTYYDCPWCGIEGIHAGHRPDCPAFTIDGKVR